MATSALSCGFCGIADNKNVLMCGNTPGPNKPPALICEKCIRIFHRRLFRWLEEERNRIADTAFGSIPCREICSQGIEAGVSDANLPKNNSEP